MRQGAVTDRMTVLRSIESIGDTLLQNDTLRRQGAARLEADQVSPNRRCGRRSVAAQRPAGSGRRESIALKVSRPYGADTTL